MERRTIVSVMLEYKGTRTIMLQCELTIAKQLFSELNRFKRSSRKRKYGVVITQHKVAEWLMGNDQHAHSCCSGLRAYSYTVRISTAVQH